MRCERVRDAIAVGCTIDKQQSVHITRRNTKVGREILEFPPILIRELKISGKF